MDEVLRRSAAHMLTPDINDPLLSDDAIDFEVKEDDQSVVFKLINSSSKTLHSVIIISSQCCASHCCKSYKKVSRDCVQAKYEMVQYVDLNFVFFAFVNQLSTRLFFILLMTLSNL